LEEAKRKEPPKKAPVAKKNPDPNDIFTDKDVVGNEKSSTEVKYKRDVTPMPDYYKAWDKFNVDKALASDDEEEAKKPSKITYKEPEAPKS
jgi:hypothetical protein